MSILNQHIGHRLELLPDLRLRCHDCTHTLLLPSGVATTSTSHSPIPGKDEPRCRLHLTEHAHTCRACAADAKAADGEAEPKPLAGWAGR